MSDENMKNENGDQNGGGPGGKSGGERDDVCRDFLKNICNRGSRCKFYHPPGVAEAAKPRNDDQINFCIDFQNRGCQRSNCRFVHASRDEVERYKERERRARGLPPSGGEMPIMRGGGPPAGYPPPMYGGRRPGPPMEPPFEAKRPRMGEDPMRVTELERKNGELMKEVEGLKRELQRERERYEDLYALFRQQSGGGGSSGPGPKMGIGAGNYQGGGYGSGSGWGGNNSWN
ncbi:hypothetical protein WR25_07682 [Diploscapter pachys]|uniref:C3H1-type domain-containing protein n=1 Tax=Diploscapter pachys TaxID=2018661 RepID=A0A2A2JPN9_9BILA|nr:hypothetical protein WR25_07682 [Diploscapter pachys]